MGLLDDKVALITGGTSGCGALVRAGRSHGYVAGRREGAGKDTVDEIKQSGYDVVFHRADIAVAADVAALVDSIVQRHGRIDVAFNNAAVGSSGALIVDTSEEEFDRLIAIVEGRLLVFEVPNTGVDPARRLRHFHEFDCLVIRFSGSSGLFGSKRRHQCIRPCCRHRTRGRWHPRNVVSPAGIMTPMSAAYFERAAARFGGMQAIIDASNAMHPLGRMAQPMDIAQAAVFLASGQSGMITGQILSVDGGMSASSVMK